MDKFAKIIVGFVAQTFEQNDDGKMVCVEQEFIAGDEVSYEDEHGEPITFFPECPYQSYDMVQPEQPKQFVVIDNSCGVEIGDHFEANSLEEAHIQILEELGHKIKEIVEEQDK